MNQPRTKYWLLLLLYFSFVNFLFPQCLKCSDLKYLKNGLVLCHPFNGNANDESGNGFNGSTINATLINDRFGNSQKAYNFDGVSSYITLSQNLPDMTTSTYSVWLRPTGNTTAVSILFWDGDSQCGNDFAIWYEGGKIGLVDTKNGGTTSAFSNTSDKYTLASSIENIWTHLIWTIDNISSKIYINGNLVFTLNKSGSNVGNHGTPTYGCFNDGNGSPCGSPKGAFFKGSIDDVRIYNRVLSIAEILQLYQLQSIDVISSIVPSSNGLICEGDSTQLNATPSITGGTYLWSSGKSLNDSTIKSPKAFPKTNTNYLVTYTLAGCSTTANV